MSLTFGYISHCPIQSLVFALKSIRPKLLMIDQMLILKKVKCYHDQFFTRNPKSLEGIQFSWISGLHSFSETYHQISASLVSLSSLEWSYLIVIFGNLSSPYFSPRDFNTYYSFISYGAEQGIEHDIK